MMTISPPATAYAGAPDVRGFYARLLERVRALPGVESAATGTGVLQPLVDEFGHLHASKASRCRRRKNASSIPVEIVSPGYFETVGMTVSRGRDFTDADHADAPRVVVINETFARTGWPGEDPLGRRIRAGDENSQAPWLTVVGVIRDAHRAEVTRAIRPELYTSRPAESRHEPRRCSSAPPAIPMAIVPAVRREVQALDPQLPLFAVTTLETRIAVTLTQPRFQAVLLGGLCRSSRSSSRRSASTASPRTPSASARRRSAFAWRWAPRAGRCCG